MSEINIRVEPGQQIEVGGKRYEAVSFRCPGDGEHWLCEGGGSVNNDIRLYRGYGPLLILRPLPVRKVPTDQDAAVWPRRKCWVRDDERQPWRESVLVSVTNDGYRFSTINHLGERVCWQFCEIEVEE